MTRTSTPPSGVVASADRGATDVLVARRDQLLVAREVDPQLDAVEEAALVTSHSGGASMCSSPDPAVIHWVSPSVIVPPPPLLSWWSKTPSMM